MVAHPTEFAFASASAENVKKFALPEGTFLHNMLQQQRAIVNTMAVNEEGVMATGEAGMAVAISLYSVKSYLLQCD